MAYDNRNTGVLFPNDKGGNDRRPDYKGTVNVNGTEYQLSGWKKSSKAGNAYLSLSVQPMRARDDRKPEASREAENQQHVDDFQDDDIPF